MPYLICPACGAANHSTTGQPAGARCVGCEAALNGSERRSARVRRWLLPLTVPPRPRRVERDLD